MIGIIGINHKTAPVDVRERFVFKEQEIEQFIGVLKKECEVGGGVVLSTCNRTEVIFTVQSECNAGNFTRLVQKLADFKDIKIDLKEHFYTYSDEDAVKHLFQVAAGLDSLVLGENQVLGQVKEAYRISSERKLTETVLNRLFHKAFEAGKKVRTDTSINEGASSVGFAAVEVASKIFGDLSRHSTLLIGAGETGELVLQSLTDRGCRSIFVTNRTKKRAEDLAARYEAEVVDFKDFRLHLQGCDIIITSTASMTPLVQYEDVREAARKRKDRPIFFIDLSVPRDISDEVKKLENVFLYNIDDLQEVVAHNSEKRKNEIRKAQKIIKVIVADFHTWVRSLNLTPTIGSLKVKLKSITDNELKNLAHKITEEEYQRVSDFAHMVNKKYLGLVIKNLKALSHDGSKIEYIEMVNRLFELSIDTRDTE